MQIFRFCTLKLDCLLIIYIYFGFFTTKENSSKDPMKFSDADSVSLFNQFPYNNATFEQYFSKFSLQNIEN